MLSLHISYSAGIGTLSHNMFIFPHKLNCWSLQTYFVNIMNIVIAMFTKLNEYY